MRFANRQTTQKHVQEELSERIAARAVAMVGNEARIREALAATGSPDPVSQGGHYDAQGKWVEHWRFGDKLDGSKKLAP